MGYSPEDTLFDVLFANEEARSYTVNDPVMKDTLNTEAIGDKRNVIGSDGKPFKGYGFFPQKYLWEDYRKFGLGHGHDLADFDTYHRVRGLKWPVVDGKETQWRFNSDYDPYAKKEKISAFEYANVIFDPSMPTKIFKALESLSIKTTSVKTATKKQEQKDLYSLKVLIAEDNPINQKLLQTTLKGLGIESDIANNGLEAFNKYTMNPDKYDVIFMDVQMPVMDGVEATHEILEYEEEEEIPHTPIIAVTANVLKGDREKFLGAGMDEYISKPISRDALLKILERVAQGEFSKEYNEPVKQTPQQEQTEKIPEQTNQQIQKEKFETEKKKELKHRLYDLQEKYYELKLQ